MKFSHSWVEAAEHRYLGSDVSSPEREEGGTKRFGEQDGSEIRWRGGRYRVRAAG